jgi:hypothetical protein
LHREISFRSPSLTNTEIFNSNNKLVHKKFTATGSASVGEGYGHQYGVTLNTTFNTDKDVALIFVTFTAGKRVSNQSGDWLYGAAELWDVDALYSCNNRSSHYRL